MQKVSINAPNEYHLNKIYAILHALDIPYKFDGKTIITFDKPKRLSESNIKAIFSGYIFKIIKI